MKNGKTEEYCVGVRRAGETDSITGNSIFQAASLTKVVTAYAFFRLYDRGLIHPDTALSRYYSYDRLQNEPRGKLITARMVLTHRSGLQNWEGPVGQPAWYQTPLHLQFDPGTRYSYSGEGFYYLQRVMEKITGKPLREIIREEVLQPFGMLHSDMQWNERLFTDYAYGHDSIDRARKLGKWSYTNAAYTLYTTAADYTRFIQNGLLAGGGLKPSTHQLMTGKAAEAQKEAGVTTAQDRQVPCALGMRLQYNEKGAWIWHTGSNPGFRCFFIAHLKTGESLATFNNSETGMPVFNELLHLFLEKGQHFPAYTWREGEMD